MTGQNRTATTGCSAQRDAKREDAVQRMHACARVWAAAPKIPPPRPGSPPKSPPPPAQARHGQKNTRFRTFAWPGSSSAGASHRPRAYRCTACACFPPAPQRCRPAGTARIEPAAGWVGKGCGWVCFRGWEGAGMWSGSGERWVCAQGRGLSWKFPWPRSGMGESADEPQTLRNGSSLRRRRAPEPLLPNTHRGGNAMHVRGAHPTPPSGDQARRLKKEGNDSSWNSGDLSSVPVARRAAFRSWGRRLAWLAGAGFLFLSRRVPVPPLPLFLHVLLPFFRGRRTARARTWNRDFAQRGAAVQVLGRGRGAACRGLCPRFLSGGRRPWLVDPGCFFFGGEGEHQSPVGSDAAPYKPPLPPHPHPHAHNPHTLTCRCGRRSG